eukprot:4054620-Pyramimonas_sp.AAC.2
MTPIQVHLSGPLASTSVHIIHPLGSPYPHAPSPPACARESAPWRHGCGYPPSCTPGGLFVRLLGVFRTDPVHTDPAPPGGANGSPPQPSRSDCTYQVPEITAWAAEMADREDVHDPIWPESLLPRSKKRIEKAVSFKLDAIR